MSKSTPSASVTPRDVIGFWLDAGPEKWFSKDPQFDAELTRRFADAADRAAEGAFDGWCETTEGTLALILLLDQFRRNIHRETPQAFSADPKALEIAKSALARRLDQDLPRDQRKWLYLPFEHAEDLATQEQSVALFEANGIEDDLKWAVEHRDIIARFGRFPHRNAILGRTTTPEEEEFLASGGFAG
jgi:uncharacterized protein (DUF924 family)